MIINLLLDIYDMEGLVKMVDCIDFKLYFIKVYNFINYFK